MDNTNNTSTKAIIFTIMFLLFVTFISLFRGITLYDIKLNNIKIGNIFFKIDKKIILKVNNIKILPTKNYNKEAIKIHRTFYLISKVLPIFEKLELNNIYKGNILLIKKLDLNKNHFIIKTPFLTSKGKYEIKNDKTYIFAKKVNAFNYKIKNFTFESKLNKKDIKAFVKGIFNNQKFYIHLFLKNNIANLKGYINGFLLTQNKINLKTKNIKFKGIVNLNNQNFSFKLFTPFIKIKNNQIFISSNKNNIFINNNYFTLEAKKGFINYNKYKLNLKNYNFNYYLPQQLILADSKRNKIIYDKYIINTINTHLDYNLKNNNLFLHTNNIKLNNDINASIKEALVIKNKKLSYKLFYDKVEHKYANLKTDLIKGNLKEILSNDIIGKILNFNLLIKSPKIDLTKKEVQSNKIVFNKINFTNNIFVFNKKPFIFSSHTNTLFNQNVKDILNYFKINIPLTQISGQNDINFSVKTDLNNTFIKYTALSKDSNFSFNLNNSFYYQNLKIKGDLNKTNITLNNFKFQNSLIKLLFDTNTTVNIPQKYINSNMFIKQLKIDNYFNIKNYKEKAAIDLINNYAYFLKSAIFINLNKKIIYLYSLKPILQYSILKEIFEDGNIMITLLKNKTLIEAKTILNYPLILNQKNPKKLNVNIIMDNDNNLIIKNKFMNTQIFNFTKIISYIHNLDIDVQGLINIINTTDKLSSKKNKTHTNPKVVIIANNTNFIYKKHKFLTQKATLTFNNEIHFSANYKKSSLKGYTKNNYLLIEGKNYSKKELIPLFDFFNHFNYINVDFVTVKSPDNFYTGKIYINKASVKDLKTLNNIIAFINTIPSLLSLKTPGFSAKGYKIKNGFISYLFYNNILYFKQININGKNISFKGKGYVDLNKNKIKLKIHTIVKLKLKNIPILGKGLSYLFFGKDGYLHINIFVNGDLNNPKVSKDLGGGVIETPLTIFKRILTLPFNLF